MKEVIQIVVTTASDEDDASCPSSEHGEKLIIPIKKASARLGNSKDSEGNTSQRVAAVAVRLLKEGERVKVKVMTGNILQPKAIRREVKKICHDYVSDLFERLLFI